jgi:sorbitol/mannitol transport system permease protein
VFFTVVLTVTVVIVSLALGLGISLLLNRNFFGRGIVRTFMITPFLIVPVAAALLWIHAIYNPVYGLLNGLLTLVGGPQPDWITDFPRLAIEVQLIWYWTPFMTLILLAGLQSRPGDVLEAANVDGANSWQTFRFITMPHMRRYLELGGLLGSIYVIQTFDTVFVMTAGSLGTANLPFTVYETLYSAQDYGLASARDRGSLIIIATFLLRTVSSLFERKHDHRTRSPPHRYRKAKRRSSLHREHGSRTGNTVAGLAAWIIGIPFFFPVWMVLTSLHSEANASTNPPSFFAPLTLRIPSFRRILGRQPRPPLINSANASIVSTIRDHPRDTGGVRCRSSRSRSGPTRCSSSGQQDAAGRSRAAPALHHC